MTTEDQENAAGSNGQGGGGGGASDVHRLSRTGTSLYELLDIPKTATVEEIRKKYRRLALKYHPDKNPGDPEAEDTFKKINHANVILSDEKKRRVYDNYGSFGLYIAEQFGDDVVDHIMLFSSKWFQCLFWSCCLLTGCYFCCCGFCCCCCFCCGKCKPDVESQEDVPDLSEFERGEENVSQGEGQENEAAESEPVVRNQPGASSSTSSYYTSEDASKSKGNSKSSAESNESGATEKTALKKDEKTSYTPGNPTAPAV